MSAQQNAPVIIKRKKVIQGGGHHGGAWKVAYADFVTAMMAFFMLMWLLNATTEKQRKGIADYFSPTIPVNRISGGGEGAFGGTSVFSEVVLAKNGTGASDKKPTESAQARGRSGVSEGASEEERAKEDQAFRDLEEALQGTGGESLVSEQALKHVLTRVTDEGLVVELFSLDGAPLFEDGQIEPTPLLVDLAEMVSGVFDLVRNDVAVAGHSRAHPIVLAINPVWDLSQSRADAMRRLMEAKGLEGQRIKRVTGYADRRPHAANPMAIRNDRLELVLLRSDI